MRSSWAIAGAGLLALAASGCARKPAASGEPPPRTAHVVRIEQRRLNGGVVATGVLIPREEVAIFPELSGYRVAKVLVEADARVAAGQPLAQLDDTLLRSQIEQQKALVAQQQVAADQADAQARRSAGLDGRGVLSAEQLDQRKFQARSARAALAAQQAQLHDLQVRDERMTIRAPTAGLVLDRNVRPGDVVSGGGGTAMFRIARDSLIELKAQPSEADLASIHVGDTVEVELSGGTKVEGTVRLVSPSIDDQTRLGEVRVRLPVREDIRDGGFGQATFTGASRLVSAAPETALRYDADGVSVMVVGADDRVSEVPVKPGLHAGGYVELIKGPPVGARVLSGATVFVLTGDKVQPIEDAARGGTR